MLVINLLFGVCICVNQDLRVVCLRQIGQLIMSNSSWEVLKTIPKVENFEQSLRLMDSSQVDLNIAEISLLTLTSKDVLKWYGQSITKTHFYLKYRYVLESLLNGKISQTLKSSINFACSKFDQQFVNGDDSEGSFKNSVMYKPFKKQSRLNLIMGREEISTRLDQLSHKIFQIQGDELKRQYFQSKIADINNYLLKLEFQVVMPKLQEKQIAQNEGIQQQIKGMYICSQQCMRKVKQISLTNSYYIKTKNRHPLVLDFTFAKFIYKNDQQLSHEIIAIELIKYVNAILGKEYIIAYQIIPQKYGAFYEFVENSKTISEIKGSQENNSLQSYFSKLCEKQTPDNILGKFAQTYSGFCLIQYLLDIKDRNNANIMVRQDGAIFHIDLAFIFSSGPGGLNFQSAPFKMTKEYVKILGGFQSDYFRKFQALLVQHFTKVVQCKDELMWKLKTLSQKNKEIRCFSDFSASSFAKKIPSKLEKVKSFVEDLIDKSYDSWKTNKYDDYQLSKNGILK